MAQKEDLFYPLAQQFFISGYTLEYIAAATLLPIETIQLWKAHGDWDTLKESQNKNDKIQNDVPSIALLEEFAGMLHIIIDALKTDYKFGCAIYHASMHSLKQIINGKRNTPSSTSPGAQ